jgi:hypothetical protein
MTNLILLKLDKPRKYNIAMHDSLSSLQNFIAFGARKPKVSKPKFIHLYMYIQKRNITSILHFKILLSKKKKLKEIIHFLVKKKKLKVILTIDLILNY